MGAGKSTLGPDLAERLGRPFVSIDELVETRTGQSVSELFEARGEAGFRELEEETAAEVLGRSRLAVIEIGGGGLGSDRTRAGLEEAAFTLQLETTPEEAWDRVAGSDRPLARDRELFEALFEQRQPLYEEVADARAHDVDGAVLAAAGVYFLDFSRDEQNRVLPGCSSLEVVIDSTVASLYGDRVRAALAEWLLAVHEVPGGESAKTAAQAERLWSALRLDRHGLLVAIGGGSTLDLGGFVAATYLRGVRWVAIPTTLVAQVDAAIGGKTAVDLPEGKNLAGAFHWPARVLVDPGMLDTLPESERRNGLAEIVKTGLLAGEPLWELETREQVRRCASFKAALCLRDPLDRGERNQLNLGHTFAHALEAASEFELQHGQAVALGLLAALRLSGLEAEAKTVERLLHPEPVQVDRDAAWAALMRDKKAERGTPKLVLLDAPGRPRLGVELAEADVRSALESLIA